MLAGNWLQFVVTAGGHSREEQVPSFDGEVVHSPTLGDDPVVQRSWTTPGTGPRPGAKLQFTFFSRLPGAAGTIAIDSRYYAAVAAKLDGVLRFVIRRVGTFVRSLELN